MELGHKRALVTGGAVGIGGAVVRRLAAEGAQVLVAGIDAEAGRATAGELGAWFVGAEPQTSARALRPCGSTSSSATWSSEVRACPTT